MSKRYWLIGGTVSLVVGAIFWFMVIYFSSRVCLSVGFTESCSKDWNKFFELLTNYHSIKKNFVLVFLPILFLIPIGVVTGWLYGKIKNRKKLGVGS